MSFWKEVSHIGHHISHGIDHAFSVANHYGHKWFGGGPGHENEGGTDWYIGYNSNTGFEGYVGQIAKDVMDAKLDGHGSVPHTDSIQNYSPKPRPESGYSRNVAATAKDIAQGGMTKDEVIEFNMRHPNETAKRSE